MKQKRHLPHGDSRIWTAIVLLMFCLYGAVWSYHALYMKTPDYAFSVIADTAQRGDMGSLTAAVDTDAMESQLFDAITKHSTQDTSGILSIQLTWSPLKETFTTASDTILTGYIVGDSDSDVMKQAQEAFKKPLKSLGFPIPPEGWQFKTAHWSHRIGNGTAELRADFYNETLQATIPVDFTMERTGTTSWRITGLAHPEDILDAIQAAYTKQLVKKNEPTQQQIDNIITIKNVTATLIGEPNDTQRFLRIQYVPDFKMNREDIDEIKGMYTLSRRSDGAKLFTADLRLSTASEKQTYVTQFRLNPLIPSHYALIQAHDVNDTNSNLTITSIRLKDSTNYAISTQLWPEDSKPQD